MLKRIFVLLFAVLLCSATLFGCSNGTVDPTTDNLETDSGTLPVESGDRDDETQSASDDDEPDGKAIDLYFITGQSNGTGNSKITNQQAISAFASQAVTGFQNVLYAGNSRSNSGDQRDRIIEWQPTKIGFGAASNTFGPEVGMAKAFSAYYNEETGKEAGIIKYAYNGSSLLNKTSGSTNQDGNWVSPSYQKKLPAYEVVENVTGQMYRNFLQQAETNISQLKEKGYTKFRIRGMFWMQGCRNKNDSLSAYETAFSFFAKDVRADLAEIMKKCTGTDDDCGAANMPIVVGTISQTQNLTSGSVEAVNIAFINMQKGLANLVENCYVVDNSQYKITGWENNQQVVYGSDKWHWNQADMLEIGKNAGEMLLSVS